MENILISIVVPIYNVEQYLSRCVDSLINQTYENLEIILVDDGSLDRCGEICDKYAKKDGRIVVIHKANGGLSDARNKGLDVARGDYIMFVDSDDWLELDACAIVASIISRHNPDVVSFGLQLVNDNKIIEIQKVNSPAFIPNRECVGAMIYQQKQKGLLNYVCNKAFRKELFVDVRFPKGMLFEDQDVTYMLMHKAGTIFATDNVFYNYYQRNESIMSGYYRPKALYDRITIWLKRYDFLCRNYPEFAEYQLAQVLGDIYVGLIRLKKETEYIDFWNKIKCFASKHKDKELELTRYSKKIMLHFYCYPIFYLYVKYRLL